MQDIEMPWPDIFESPGLVQTMDERKLCAQMLCAWAACSIAEAPDNFGDVMVASGKRLGIVPDAAGIESFARKKGWLE